MNQASFYYVLAIDQERSFSKAAKKLGISQPALSSYINKIEGRLGSYIFDRTVSPVELTDVGRIYLDYVRKSLLLEQDLKLQIDDINSLKTGNLTIGGANSFTISYFPKANSEFQRLYPDISIKITDARVPELAELALKGELDFFIAGAGIDASGLELRPFLRERIFLCLPKQWELNNELKDYRVPEADILNGTAVDKEYANIPLDLLKDCSFVLLDKDLLVRQIAEQLFNESKFTPKHVILIDQMMTSLALTVSGNGICFISENNIRYGNVGKLPAFYAFDRRISIRELAVAYRKNKYLSQACKKYMDILCGLFSGGKDK